MIVIPMAGLSSRFFKDGYTKPKYMLMAHGKSLFEHAIGSFEKYYNNELFIFIIRDVYDTLKFIERKVCNLGIKNYYIAVLDKETRGQAETVALGLNCWEEENKNSLEQNNSLTIFNIDTFRPGFIFPDISNFCDGYLEVFRGQGSNWSFVKPMNGSTCSVSKTTEKKPISDLCCTGLYFFKSYKKFLEAFEHYANKPSNEWDSGELYVAPLYNYLIEKGYDISFHLIHKKDVIFCGIPEEYNEFLNHAK